MSDRRFVLDASAAIALIRQEPGANRVAVIIVGAAISAVNLAEVVTKFVERGVSKEDVAVLVDRLRLQVFPLTEEAAVATGELRRLTRSYGLSLGDRACLALAIQLGATALTTDGAWARIPPDIAQVELIR